MSIATFDVSRRLASAFLACGLLSGCVAAKFSNASQIPVSTPPWPMQTGPSAPILDALECIRASGKISSIRFAVAIHADGTGKTSFGYEGATGSYLPQGTTAMWAAQAVMLAGGQSMNYYELNTERAMRQFGGQPMEGEMSGRLGKSSPHFVISTAFTALDFLAGSDLDARVGGIGPNSKLRGASLEGAAEIYRPGDRTTLAMSTLSRQVLYRQIGFGVSRIVGDGPGELISGGISFSDQQRIQEATRDLVALSVADVLSNVPAVPGECRAKVAEIKAPPPPVRIALRATAGSSLPQVKTSLENQFAALSPVPNVVQRKDAAEAVRAPDENFSVYAKDSSAAKLPAVPAVPPKPEVRVMAANIPSIRPTPRPDTSFLTAQQATQIKTA
ncbi:MAG: hypothetical protein RJB58_1950, partial [Pseudomonadota bacterium]